MTLEETKRHAGIAVYGATSSLTTSLGIKREVIHVLIIFHILPQRQKIAKKT